MRKYFHMHIRKYNRAFGRDVCHKRAYHGELTLLTFLSKHAAVAWLLFSATRGYTACTCMQRQYCECIMNGACALSRGTGGKSKVCLVNSAQVYFHILHSRNSHLQQQFSPTYTCNQYVSLAEGTSCIVNALVCACVRARARACRLYYFLRSTSRGRRTNFRAATKINMWLKKRKNIFRN